MNKLLLARAALIAALFSLFGGVLSALYDVDDIRTYVYISMACLFSFITSLLISFFLTGKWNAKIKKIYIIILPVFFIISFAGFIWYETLFDKYTFSYTPYSIGSDSLPHADTRLRLLRSDQYTDTVKKIIRDNNYTNESELDSSLIDNWAGGYPLRNKLWVNGAISGVKIYLMSVYIGLIIVLTIIISILIEVLFRKYHRTE
jgi:hypothetical protein